MSEQPSSVAQLLRSQVARGGLAVRHGDDTVSWTELADLVERELLMSLDHSALAWVSTAPDATAPLRPLVRLLAALRQPHLVALPHPRWPASLTEATHAQLARCPLPVHDDAQTVLFSSGSSGHPKPVVHHVETHIAAARASHLRVPFGRGDRWLLSLPLCHVGGLAIVFRALTAGAAMELPLPDERATDALMRAQPTHVSLVAAQLSALLDDEEGIEALRQCREILVGGGPVAPGLVARAADAGIALRQTYGATELCAQACTSEAGAPASCGRALDGVEVKIDGDSVICVRSPFALRGYLSEEGLTAPLDTEGYWRSGDVGHLDDRGGLVVTGRADHRFISGGENIHPEMIEAALVALPDVQQAVVVDVADAQFGARPAAFLVAPGLELDPSGEVPAQLTEALTERLPRFMLPVAAWPLESQSGLKPQRARLRALARARRG